MGEKDYIETIWSDGYVHGYTLRDSENVDALDDIPSPFAFRILDGRVFLTDNPGDTPVFGVPTSEQEHSNPLEACRILASDLACELKGGKFNVRVDYAESLLQYCQRLPRRGGDSNILLADAAARTLRNMFAADVECLPVAFASKLKTIPEQHISVRVYYPEISRFYSDVQTGHIEEPLPLDAVQEVIRGVVAHTPGVFDPAIKDAIVDSTEPKSGLASALPTKGTANSTQPIPPPDPLGELDPRKARDFAIAGVINSLWRAFLQGEKIYKALDGWASASKALRRHVPSILGWLRDFSGPGGGG